MSEAPTPRGTFRIRFAKEDFKFSSAHFTLFSGQDAELLHGHNYRVWLELAGRRLGPHGLLLAFDPIKRAVRALCAELDGKVLLPADAEELALRETGGEIELSWNARRYRFPSEEVAKIPIANTSIELLAQYFWRRIVETEIPGNCETLGVGVEETRGQSCFFEASLPG